MAFSRVKDKFSKISVSTGYKVKSRKGCGRTAPYRSRREAGQASWYFLVGWVQALLRIASDLPRGRVVGSCVLCVGGLAGREMFLRMGASGSWGTGRPWSPAHSEAS